jgi:hypothetical protein
VDIRDFRWPIDGEPPAQLVDVTELEVVEAITTDADWRFEYSVEELMLHVWSVTGSGRFLFVLLTRSDRAGMWRPRLARPMTAREQDLYRKEIGR